MTQRSMDVKSSWLRRGHAEAEVTHDPVVGADPVLATDLALGPAATLGVEIDQGPNQDQRGMEKSPC